ncbi:hypothetical protein QTP88_007025 [Uroleucon formosanum]
MDGVSVVCTASPYATRCVVSSVVGRWPAASPSSAASPQQRAISRSSCSSSIRNSRRFYAMRTDRDRGETVEAVTPNDNYEKFSSEFTGAVRAAVTVYGFGRAAAAINATQRSVSVTVAWRERLSRCRAVMRGRDVTL